MQPACLIGRGFVVATEALRENPVPDDRESFAGVLDHCEVEEVGGVVAGLVVRGIARQLSHEVAQHRETGLGVQHFGRQRQERFAEDVDVRVDQSCGLSVQQIDGEVPVLGSAAQRSAAP
ncbi:hypothetical protein GS538_00070 [Rhodococcus hoagii]|nr:hypothetical protein [Prescottella equi]